MRWQYIYSVRDSVSEMTYIVSGGALNSTHSLTLCVTYFMTSLTKLDARSSDMRLIVALHTAIDDDTN